MIKLDDRKARELMAAVRDHLVTGSMTLSGDLELLDELDAAASPRLKIELDGLRVQILQRIHPGDAITPAGRS